MMISIITFSLAAAFLLTLAFEALTAAMCTRCSMNSARDEHASPRRPRPALALGLLSAIGILWVWAPRAIHGAGGGAAALAEGPNLIIAMLGGIPLYIAGLETDARRPRSERHLAATLIGGLILCFSDFRINYIGIPGLGVFSLPAVAGGALTILWVFLVVSIVEVAGLLPLLSGLIALAIGGLGCIPGLGRPTASGYALSGILAGAALARGVGGLVFSSGRSLEKAEILTLGYVCAVTTLATFMKSVALAGVILPLSLVTIVLILILMHGFEETILLRAKPRD